MAEGVRELTADEREALDKAVLGVLSPNDEDLIAALGYLSDRYCAVGWEAITFAIFDTYHGLPMDKSPEVLRKIGRLAAEALTEATGRDVAGDKLVDVLEAATSEVWTPAGMSPEEGLVFAVMLEAGLLLLSTALDPEEEWSAVAGIIEVGCEDLSPH